MPRYPTLTIAFVLACMPAISQSAEPSSVLGDLARSLAETRASPEKARAAACPSNARAVVGLPLGQVLVELGQPDSSKDGAITYSFGRASPDQRGGGFPELTFRFNAQGAVTAVECLRAR